MTLIRNILLAAAAITFFSSIVMWWRSYWTIDSISFSNPTRITQFVSAAGRLSVSYSVAPPNQRKGIEMGFASKLRAKYRPIWDTQREYGARRFFGFEWTRQIKPLATSPQGETIPERFDAIRYLFVPTSLIAIPYWFVTGIAFIPLFLFAISYHQTLRRLRAGHCPVCGYDLRATPDRCPECGTEISTIFKLFAASS